MDTYLTKVCQRLLCQTAILLMKPLLSSNIRAYPDTLQPEASLLVEEQQSNWAARF